MKRFLILLLIPCFYLNAQVVKQDSTAVPKAYTNAGRLGTAIIGRADTLWRFVQLDKSGAVFTTEALTDSMNWDTLTVTTTWDTIPDTTTWNRFEVFCDNLTMPFYFALGADTLEQTRCQAGKTLVISGEADSVCVKVDSTSAKITVRRFKRKTY